MPELASVSEWTVQVQADNQDSNQTVPIRDTTSLRSSGGRLAGRPAASRSRTPFVEEPGGRFGRFELVERLGSGGFGTVWKAYDTVLKRSVALKIPHADRFCPQGTSVLVQEARNVASLKHAGLALVYDVGEESGTPYIEGPGKRSCPSVPAAAPSRFAAGGGGRDGDGSLGSP